MEQTTETLEEGGKLDGIEETKTHLGFDDEEWNKLSESEQNDFRKQSYTDLKEGEKNRERQEVEQPLINFLWFDNWEKLYN